MKAPRSAERGAGLFNYVENRRMTHLGGYHFFDLRGGANHVAGRRAPDAEIVWYCVVFLAT